MTVFGGSPQNGIMNFNHCSIKRFQLLVNICESNVLSQTFGDSMILSICTFVSKFTFVSLVQSRKLASNEEKSNGIYICSF